MKFSIGLFLLHLITICVPEVPPPHEFSAPPPPPPLSRAQVGDLIRDAAARHNVSAALVSSVVAAESAFRSDAVSDKGAVGLMQVMPATALDMGLDAAIPEQNIEAGTRYLAQLIGRYRDRSRNWLRRSIAAYNAGPANVDKYKGVPPFRETRAYVTRVLAYFHAYTNRRPDASLK